MLTLCYRSAPVNYQWGLAVSVYVAHWPRYIPEILLKVELNTITPKPNQPSENLHQILMDWMWKLSVQRIFDWTNERKKIDVFCMVCHWVCFSIYHLRFSLINITLKFFFWSEWLLFNANSAIFSAISWREQVNFQWDDDEVRFVLENTQSWIFIVLAHWKNSLWVDMSLHSDTLFWFWVN